MQGISQGTTLAGRYTLIRRLSQQDAHEQWNAADTTLDREVLVTVISGADAHTAAALDSARRAAGVEDHHLARVLDVGAHEGTAFIVSEALHGAESIGSIVQFDTLPAEEARRMIGETATGLNAAAARGLHHLMLTPNHVMRARDGSVTLLGVATDAALAGKDDQSGDDASRTDTVSLVQVLYTALTGRWPGPTAITGLPSAQRRADGVLPAPSELVTGVPGDLDTLCRTILNDDDGPTTPGELARQLSPWSSERVHGAGGRPVGHHHGTGTAAAPAGSGGRGSFPDDPENPDKPRSAAADAAITGAGAGLAGAGLAGALGSHHRHDLPDLTDSGDETMVGRRPEFDTDETTTFDAAQARERARQARSRSPEVDLEPPLPLLQAGTTEPDHGTSRLAVGIVVVFVVVALILGAFGVSHAFTSPGSKPTAAPATSSSASRTPSKSSKASKSHPPSKSSSPAPTSGTPIKVVGATSFDPEGTGNVHNELAPYAIDGKPQTAWMTHYYSTPTYNGIKSGAGLILDLGSSQQVGSVKVSLTGGPSTVQVFVTDKQSITGDTPFGTIDNGSGDQTVTGAKPKNGRYVILWITKLSLQNSGHYREIVNEVQVLS